MKLVPLGADPCRFVARIPDLDVPIRRIFRLNWLLEAIGSNEMALVAPHEWDDPREDPSALCMLDGCNLIPCTGQQSLAEYLAPVWAQCWSLNPGSDPLLRAYSTVRLDPRSGKNTFRENEGVTVTTTVRRLLSAAESWIAGGANSHIVVGQVEYLDDKEIWQRIVNICNGSHGPKFFCTVQGRADSLLWKRTYFSHEKEVRLLMIQQTWCKDEPASKFRRVAIDINSLFTSISFDPRLQNFEVREREAECRKAGYVGKVTPDLNYQKVLSQLVMTRDWPAPNGNQ